jgi:hypothetical protein
MAWRGREGRSPVMKNSLTRRDFGVLLAAGSAASAAALPTAAQAVERMKQQLAKDGIPWERTLSPGAGAGTVDTIKIGNPETPVTGIAICFMSTLENLQRAVKARKNFIISHEPTFWNHLDDVSAFQNDSVYRAKKLFVEDNHLVVWRFHDHLHMMRPEPISTALERQFRWDTYATGNGFSRVYVVPPTTLKEVGLHLQNALGTRNVRIAGDPDLPVTRIGNAIHGMDTCMHGLNGNDAVLVGETREFDTPLYMRDARRLGINKGLIIIAHERLEDWGMEQCTRWVAPIFPELPVEYLSAGDPFWIPQQKTD